MKTIMVTGATSGLGLEITRRLAMNQDTHVIMGVRDLVKGMETARKIGKNVSAVHLDLSSLHDVASFVKGWRTRLDGLVNNAGVQFSNQESFTPDSFEETISVNHLAAFMLTTGLENHLAGGKVLFIGSGTHNPKHAVATHFGFRGAQYSSVHELAAGNATSENPIQRNRDRYATSKFLVTVTAVELARRNKPYHTFVLDPGLMPGTGLARTQNAIMQFLWRRVLPFIGMFLPDTSTTKKSAAAAAWIMTGNNNAYPDGTVFSYNKKPCRHIWEEMVYDREIGMRVYEESRQIIDRFFKADH